MICKNCGGELRETAKFCPWCGEKVQRENISAEKAPEEDTEEDIKEDTKEDIKENTEKNTEEDTADPADNGNDSGTAPELAVKFDNTDDLYVVSEQPPAPVCEQPDVRISEKTVRFSFRYGSALIAAAFITVIVIASVFIVPEHIVPYMQYKKAEKYFQSGDIAAAEDIFSSLEGYRESAEYIKKCHYSAAAGSMEKGDFVQAAKAFAALDGYADSDELASECLVRSAEAYAEAGNYDAAISAYYMAGKLDLAEDTARSRAESLMESGDFFAAAEAAEKYSHEKALEYLYEGSKSAMQNGDTKTAAKGFEMLGDHNDSEQLLQECNYRIFADDYYKNGANADNVRGFHDLGKYRDSETLFVKAAYDYGNSLFDSKEYYEASLMFINAGDHENSSASLHRCRYELGRSLEKSDPDSARSIFAMLGNYSDSASRKAAVSSGTSGWYADGYTSEDGFCTSRFRNSDTMLVSCTAGTDVSSEPTTITITLSGKDGYSVSADCENVRNSGYFSASISLASAPAGQAEITISLKDSGKVLRRFEITIE